jgi:hypothetical protein
MRLSAYAWSRPVRNGRIVPRRAVPAWEPPIWIAVPLLALVGWLFMVAMLSL